MICNYFLPLHRFYFHFADGTHWYAVFFFDLVNLSIFAFVACGFEVIVTSNAMKAFSYVFLLVLDLTFSSLFHSELKFCIWCKVGRSSTLLFLMWISNFPNTICWRDCFFPITMTVNYPYSLPHITHSSPPWKKNFFLSSTVDCLLHCICLDYKVPL